MRDEPKKPFWHDIAKVAAEEADERVAQNVFSETIFCLADVLGRLALLRYGEHGQKELSELVGDVYPADVEPPPKDVTAFDLWSCAQHEDLGALVCVL